MLSLETGMSLTMVFCFGQGYGTVRFDSPATAQSAISAFHGTELEGRTLTVKLDKYA